MIRVSANCCQKPQDSGTDLKPNASACSAPMKCSCRWMCPLTRTIKPAPKPFARRVSKAIAPPLAMPSVLTPTLYCRASCFVENGQGISTNCHARQYISIQRHTSPESDEKRLKNIDHSLQERARAIADAGRNQIARFRSGDDASPWAPGAEREILSSTSAVAVGRKLLYHEGWVGTSQDAQAAAVAVGREQLFHDTMPPGETQALSL